VANLVNLPERQDADGAWHQVMRDVCYWCGCHYLYAEGECHTAPLVGRRRD
jgi:hypothetical protein